jgi:hypothetical protein
MIETATTKGVFSPNTYGRVGSIATYDFGRIIGLDINGKVTSVLKVVVNPNGTIKTAFPF